MTILSPTNKPYSSYEMPAGKEVKPLVWRTAVQIKPVLTVDLQIYDIKTIGQYPDLDRLDKLSVEILYDQEVVAYASLSDTFEKDFVFTDDKDHKEHEISFRLVGKTDDHSLLINSKSITICAQIYIEIEEFDLTSWLNGNIIGTDTPKILRVQTPIYRWLIDNRHHLVKTYLGIYNTNDTNYFGFTDDTHDHSVCDYLFAPLPDTSGS